MKDYVIPVVSVLGAVAASIVSYLMGTRKNDRSDFSVIADEYRGLIEAQNSRIKQLEETVIANETRYRENMQSLMSTQEALQEQIAVLETLQGIPMPMAFKSTQGKILHINQAYISTILHPRGLSVKDVQGNTDVAVWDEEMVSELKAASSRAMITGVHISELISEWRGAKSKWHVVSFRLRDSVAGVGEIFIPMTKTK